MISVVHATTIAARLRWMMTSRWIRILSLVLLGAVTLGRGVPAFAAAGPPPQKLPSALLMFPYIESDGNRDTRIELVNLSGFPLSLQCFYVAGDDPLCNEIGFFLSLTPYQPMTWLASAGVSNELTSTAAPPFFGLGELKCAVVPSQPDVQFHNVLQGRATVFGQDGLTVSYSSISFIRLTDGEFTGTLSLNGVTYAQCPDKLHFDVLTDHPGSTSDLILLPCSEDLLTQVPTSLNAQLLVINEFESTFSTSFNFTCFSRRALSDIADSLTRATAGSETAHLIVRGVQGALVGLVIDAVPFQAVNGTAGNEPSLQGGRSATVVFPQPGL